MSLIQLSHPLLCIIINSKKRTSRLGPNLNLAQILCVRFFLFLCFSLVFSTHTVYIKVQFVANIKKLISWFFMKTGIFLKTHKMCQCWACTSLCSQRPLMLDAKAIMSLDGLPIFPLWLTYRGQGLSAIYTHLPVFFKFTSLSIIAKRTRDEPQGTAPSPVQAQQLCATK